jgi:hypothetical protein
MAYDDKTRLVVAKRYDEDVPLVIAAMPMSTWEIIGEDEWLAWRSKRAKESLSDGAENYELIEVVMDFPASELAAMFPAEIKPTAMTLGSAQE